MHMSSGLPLGRRRPRIRPLLLAGSGPAATGCPMPLVAGLAISGADTRLRHSPLARAIEGPAVAGGLELAIWCDLRVAAEGAVLGVLSRRAGVPLIDLGTIRLPRLVGHGRAMDLILTGRAVGAAEALAM